MSSFQIGLYPKADVDAVFKYEPQIESVIAAGRTIDRDWTALLAEDEGVRRLHIPVDLGLFASRVVSVVEFENGRVGFWPLLLGALGGAMLLRSVQDGVSIGLKKDVTAIASIEFVAEESPIEPKIYIPGTITITLTGIDTEDSSKVNFDGSFVFKVHAEGFVTPVFQPDNQPIKPATTELNDQEKVIAALREGASAMLPTLADCLPTLSAGPDAFLATVGSALAPQLASTALNAFTALFGDDVMLYTSGKDTVNMLSYLREDVYDKLDASAQYHEEVLARGGYDSPAIQIQDNLVYTSAGEVSFGNNSQGGLYGQKASLVEDGSALGHKKAISTVTGDTIKMPVKFVTEFAVKGTEDDPHAEFSIHLDELFGIEKQDKAPIVFTINLRPPILDVNDIVTRSGASYGECIVGTFTGAMLKAVLPLIKTFNPHDIDPFLDALARNVGDEAVAAVGDLLKACIFKVQQSEGE